MSRRNEEEIRAVLLLTVAVIIPLPLRALKRLPDDAVQSLQWFVFWTFAMVLTVPWLLSVHQLLVQSVSCNGKAMKALDESMAPKLVVVIPCYKEIPEILVRTMDSIVDSDYPHSSIHIFLSFDDDQEDDRYLGVLERLGVVLVRQRGYPVSIDVVHKDTRITISRFLHGGKRHCQRYTFRLIEKIYGKYFEHNEDLFMLFVDSDCMVDRSCIRNLMYDMELNPGSQNQMIAMTGVVTPTTTRNSLITLIQDVEYCRGQLIERAAESACGALTCMPGALTAIRFTNFKAISGNYFYEQPEACEDLFDYAKYHLGKAFTSEVTLFSRGLCFGAKSSN